MGKAFSGMVNTDMKVAVESAIVIQYQVGYLEKIKAFVVGGRLFCFFVKDSFSSVSSSIKRSWICSWV